MTAKASLMRNILINKKGNKNDRDIICLSLLFVAHANLEQTHICLIVLVFFFCNYYEDTKCEKVMYQCKHS